MARHYLAIPCMCLLLPVLTASAQQQVTVTAPLQGINHSFYENNSIQWGASGRNWSFQFGGAAPPPFGMADPNSGLRGGIGTQFGNGFSGGLGFQFSQGSQSSFVGSAPSLTLTPGVPGHFFSGQVSPFVTGVRPVVGDNVAAANSAAVQQQQQLGAMAVQQSQHNSAQLKRALRLAEQAEEKGKIHIARTQYIKAMQFAAPTQRQEIQQQIQDMLAKAKADRLAK